VIAHFAAAFGAYAVRHGPGRTVVIGRDSRVSGPMFSRAAIAALQSVGCDVVDVGIAPTPSVQLAVEELGAAGGLAVTASHNPIEWNALKFIGPSGMFLDADQGAEMRELLEGEIPRVGWRELGGYGEDGGAIDRHLEKILAIPFLDVEKIRSRLPRGARLRARRRRRHLPAPPRGARLPGRGDQPGDRRPLPAGAGAGGREPRRARGAGPLQWRGGRLRHRPDVDRLSLVGEDGKALGEDYTLALATRLVLRHRPGKVVTNLSTSRLLDDVAEQAGSRARARAVGEINVARRMEAEGATIGGEGNGGVILPDVHLTRDAPVAAALILQLLAEEERPISEIAAEIGSYEIVKEKVDRPSGSLDEAYETLIERLEAPEVDRQDGLRLDWPEQRRWAHLRPSGTEPIVRIIAEAPTLEEASQLVESLREALPA
jgi:phosphomannomutase